MNKYNFVQKFSFQVKLYLMYSAVSVCSGELCTAFDNREKESSVSGDILM